MSQKKSTAEMTQPRMGGGDYFHSLDHLRHPKLPPALNPGEAGLCCSCPLPSWVHYAQRGQVTCQRSHSEEEPGQSSALLPLCSRAPSTR